MKLDRYGEYIIRTLLVARGKKCEVWQLARNGGHFSDVLCAVEQLRKAGVVETKHSVVTLKDTTPLPAYVLKKEKSLSTVVREYKRLRKHVRFANAAFDQLMITPEAIGHKLDVMNRRGDLLNRDILCIGDDDLFSVACALTGLPKSITVVDVDTEILSFLTSVSSKLPVPIHTVELNLTTPLPERYHNACDVFITEPPETTKATVLFVTQGLSALREGGVFYLGMTEVTMNTQSRYHVEKALLESGAVFTDIIHNNEEYEVEGNELTSVWSKTLPKWVDAIPRSPWFVSTLFRGQLVEKKPLSLPTGLTDADFSTEF